MAMSTKASLLAPHPKFCEGGSHRGVWKRKTVTSCWDGKIVKLATVEEAKGTCTCLIIRVGDEFAVARGFGNPAKELKEYSKIVGVPVK